MAVPKKIIYIMGTGRSATTILETILTNNPDVTGVGEMTHIFRDGVRRNDRCGCGMDAHDCSLWKKVFQKLSLTSESTDFYISLLRKFDWHTGFIHQVFNLFPKKMQSEYKAIHHAIFNSVSAHTGASTIVDSSKYAGRAVALHRAFPGKCKIICLTRSPMGLIRAFQRTDAQEQIPKKLLQTILYYIYVLTCCRIASHIIGKNHCVFISYEQLMKNPHEMLARIEKISGLDLHNAKIMIHRKTALRIGHIVTGNRLRKKGLVIFNPNLKNYQPADILEKTSDLLMRFYGGVLGFKF